MIKKKPTPDYGEAVCPVCKRRYTKKVFWQIYDSPDCRQTAFILKNASPKLLDKIKKGIK